MGNTEQINITEERFQGLLGRYLNLRNAENSTSEHLDQDTLGTFAEGNISVREATPIVTHLADCSFCRRITSELVRLDLAFAQTDNSALLVSERSPAKVSEVLSDLLSRIFGTTDSTVFAHHEPEEEEKTTEETDNDKK